MIEKLQIKLFYKKNKEKIVNLIKNVKLEIKWRKNEWLPLIYQLNEIHL